MPDDRPMVKRVLPNFIRLCGARWYVPTSVTRVLTSARAGWSRSWGSASPDAPPHHRPTTTLAGTAVSSVGYGGRSASGPCPSGERASEFRLGLPSRPGPGKRSQYHAWMSEINGGGVPPRLVAAPDSLVKSRQRVADHGEVFTPSWLVEDMLDLLQGESERIDARCLEPACGSGNFLVPVLRRKLATVHQKFAGSDFEKRHHALLALMCIYGIELLADNVEECRSNLLDTLFDYLGRGAEDEWFGAARNVVEVNVIHGDALKLTTSTGEPITFPEWGYLGKGKFQRRDFRYETLTQRSSIEGTLFEVLEEHEVFIPTQVYPPMSVLEIAKS